jgi:pyruvate/2-oxoglutarate dehydrogenase complex dihydrolipoamide dehydrogenase (E3) component
VPTKTLVKSARVAHLIGRSEEYGIKSSGHEIDFPAVMDRMDRVILRAGERDDPARFRKMGVDVFLGDEASFASPEEVSVDGRRLGARSVILATGSHSATPPIKGLEDVGYLTHVEALQLRRLPHSLIIIGCEFAQIFSRFGVDPAHYSLAGIRAGLASSNPRRWSRDGLPGPSSKTTRKPAM